MTYQDLLYESLGKDWSASKLGCFRTCPKQYDFKYVQRLKSKQNPQAFLGSCVHTAIQKNLLARVRKDLVISSPEEIFKGEFMQFSQKNIYPQDTPLEAIVKDYSTGISLLEAYRTTLDQLVNKLIEQVDCYGTEPQCEHKALFCISPRGEILPYTEKSEQNIGILGYIDLLMPNGSIMDIKTAARIKQLEDITYSLQFGLYSAYVSKLITPLDEVNFEVHTITKTKVPAVQVLTTVYGKEQIQDIITLTLAIVHNIQHIKSSDDFIINPNNFCKHYCDYKDLCTYGKRLCDE
ncbi:PD-(D/E)XK nuclease family protein [bacterium]|nr:PD-(D/E)XK nuclease family protein [bacterium]